VKEGGGAEGECERERHSEGECERERPSEGECERERPPLLSLCESQPEPVREGACIWGATMPQPWTLTLTLNAAALAAASPTLLFRPL